MQNTTHRLPDSDYSPLSALATKSATGRRTVRRLAGAFLAVAALTYSFHAGAQAYPVKLVRVIVPAAPGGGIDLTARIVSAKLAELWGQPVVIENRPGGSMIIGAEAAAKAAPDGYTLFVAHDGTMSMNPVVFAKLPYDPQRDFVPLSLISGAPLMLAVHPSLGVGTLREFIDHARANPGKLNHATGGTASRLALELFKAFAKVDIVNVSFNSLAPANTSLLSGETQLGFSDLASGAAAMRSGKLRLIAVTDSKRSKFFPEVSTFAEAGLPGFETRTWIAAFAPAGTPGEVTRKIGDDIRRALASPEVLGRFEKLNYDVVGSSADELAQAIRLDREKWGRLIRERGLKFDQ